MNYESFVISVGGTLLNVNATVRNTGHDLLVFLHGLGCSSETFRDVWQRPEFNEYSILCLDLPGFGRSDATRSFSYSMEDQALVCAEVLSHYPTNDIHLICHSMGGAIGLLLPQEILNRTKSFSNIEGNLNPEDCVFGSRGVSTVSYDVFVSEILPEFKRSSDNWVKNGLITANPYAFYESAKSIVAWSDSGKLLRAFRDLSCRKVYMYGEQNADHPTVATVEGISKIEITGAGHFVMNDNSDEFYSELLRFVRG
ncbi:MAG: alpha/beta hydrolase [Rhodothermia bacterium]|nr:MAG: alpha/beta hydrolase [Rhodothermia bacterium]